MLAGLAIGGGVGLISNLISSLFGPNTNAQTQAITAEETNLLNEANLQLNQEEATPGLISQRNSQEESLKPPNAPFTANNTITAPFNPVTK